MNGTNQIEFSMESAKGGKLGLALSGGGFRAALFHVGVLAQLAEQDLLRFISVISTVSGGSIIGAFYYLKVKQLLEGHRTDQLEPTADGYRLLMRELEGEFVKAIQHNLRLMTFADGGKNARMLSENYSSTMRMADLFNTLFFNPIVGAQTICLHDLPIRPIFDSVEVDAEHAAGAHAFSVPKLVLNATALNTGHLFQFTGEFVGESRISSVTSGSSAMPILERLSFKDNSLTPTQRHSLEAITLGDAVVASCCVPGLLEPYTLNGLYADEAGQAIAVRLVDGGVFDNQGLVSLYEDGCSSFISSDASDKLKWQAQPEEQIHTVAMRANDIMMDRIRNELMDELHTQKADSYIVFTLGDRARTDIFPHDALWIDALSKIRTDLDAFTDTEASALMYYGFALSGDKLGAEALNRVADWGFSSMDAMAKDTRRRDKILRALQIGSRQFMKVFYMGKALPYVIILLPMLIPIAFMVTLIYFLPPIPISAWLILGGFVITGVAFSQNARITEKMDRVPMFRRWRKRLAVAMKPLGITVILGIIGAGISLVILKVFNRLFLRYGKLE
ncbi:MAG: patatin-like phospholipase family protein [Halioglobus sp.]|nr:patatin-like phospholipase family protein [Halioglobus sp.]